jgi:DNA-directed RNA polymerase subunit RPC12/RpoP
MKLIQPKTLKQHKCPHCGFKLGTGYVRKCPNCGSLIYS